MREKGRREGKGKVKGRLVDEREERVEEGEGNEEEKERTKGI